MTLGQSNNKLKDTVVRFPMKDEEEESNHFMQSQYSPSNAGTLPLIVQGNDLPVIEESMPFKKTFVKNFKTPFDSPTRR